MRDVDQIIQSIVAKYPAVNLQRLQLRHPGADDDGLWFFNWPGSVFEVQIESSTGMSPFLIETMENDTRIIATSVE